MDDTREYLKTPEGEYQTEGNTRLGSKLIRDYLNNEDIGYKPPTPTPVCYDLLFEDKDLSAF